ncbi:MAG: response regulator [Alphaproteobacteria bacterium]|nr:response regulator [Alphaproteobacteria bacterium]
MIRVLLVQDESLHALTLEYRLLVSGYEVVGTAYTTCAVGVWAEALEPDVLLVDVNLVIGEGDEARDRLDDLGVPVLLLAGRGDEAACEEARELGYDDFVLRQAKPKDLKLAIRAAMAPDRAVA